MRLLTGLCGIGEFKWTSDHTDEWTELKAMLIETSLVLDGLNDYLDYIIDTDAS